MIVVLIKISEAFAVLLVPLALISHFRPDLSHSPRAAQAHDHATLKR